VRQEGGLVDKFIGDAIMAVFGAPKPMPNPAGAAIRTAWRLQRALDAHNEGRAARGLPPLKMGVGVHYGDALAGLIGADDRMQYTVIGDVVNTASRLESATKAEKVPVIVSRAALDAARAAPGADALPDLVERGTIPIRGRDEGLAICTFREPCSAQWA